MRAASRFLPPRWLRNRHLQTLWPVFFRRTRPGRLCHERLELDDGDFLDLCWTSRKRAPTVIIFHGLEGSIESHYAGGLMNAISSRGWRGLLMHFRGCSGTPNKLSHSYHSGETGDIDKIIRIISARDPDLPLAAVGISLGGNALLKWLGEDHERGSLQAAAAVSVPFDLACSAERLDSGFSRLYQWRLTKSLRNSVRRKFAELSCPLDLSDLDSLNSFRLFDDRITAPLHGFQGVDDYYAQSSSRDYLKHIRLPVLIIQSNDDPFMRPDCVPTDAELSDKITLELSEHGGHVGFVMQDAGASVWDYWLDKRIIEYLSEFLR